MDAVNIKREARGFAVEEIFSQPAEDPASVLFTFSGINTELPAKSNSFTLVLNRNMIESIEHSSELAIFLARKYPAERVLLVNTYAGTELLQKTLAMALQRLGVVLPPSCRRFFNWPRDEWFAEDAPPPYPINLRILDCPTSTFTPWRLEAELGITSAQIVIVNSFEFAAFSHWHRSVLAEGLLTLQQKLSLSVVIYSQEMRTDVMPFMKARGPMGVLSAHSDAIWKVMTPYEQSEYDKKKRKGLV